MSIPEIIAAVRKGVENNCECGDAELLALCDHIDALGAERDALREELLSENDPTEQTLRERYEEDVIPALRAEIERLTDAMSWSEAKAHNDAANLRVERDSLRAACLEAALVRGEAWQCPQCHAINGLLVGRCPECKWHPKDQP